MAHNESFRSAGAPQEILSYLGSCPLEGVEVTSLDRVEGKVRMRTSATFLSWGETIDIYVTASNYGSQIVLIGASVHPLNITSRELDLMREIKDSILSLFG